MVESGPGLPRNLRAVRMLGRGGSGYVVLAHDQDLDRLVAVKLVHGTTDVAHATARLLREGRALNRLDHPHVIRVFEAVAVGSRLALVMEYAEGGDLATAYPSLAVAERVRLLGQVAGALEAAHAIGIVHRDVKPTNVVLTRSGEGRFDAKLADFGLARLCLDASAFRTERAAGFTPGFSAPEQTTRPDEEDPRLDWYSFAAMAHLVLVGSMPPCREPVAAPLFAAALHPDPTRRIGPSELVERLRDLPAAVWASPSTLSAPSAETVPGVAAASAAPGGGTTAMLRGFAGAVATSVPTATWAEVPWLASTPYRPPPRRWRRTWWGAVSIGLLVGAVAGALVAVLR